MRATRAVLEVQTDTIQPQLAALDMMLTLVHRAVRCLLVVFCFAALGVAAAEFVPGVDDLPLMPGLEAGPETSTSFDTPSGRIVEVEAHGKGMGEAEVRAFYARTLPSLGWRAVNERRYERAGERLTIDFTQRQGMLVVRFDIRPR